MRRNENLSLDSTLRRILRGPRAFAHSALRWLWRNERVLVFTKKIDGKQDDSLVWSRNDVGLLTVPATVDALNQTNLLIPKLLIESVAAAPAEEWVHALAAGSEIVGWGMSASPQNGWPITETESVLDVPKGDVVMTTFFVHPSWRNRGLYQALLQAMLAREGARADAHLSAWIWCLESNIASARAIRRVGFIESQRHVFSRRCGFKTVRVHASS